MIFATWCVSNNVGDAMTVWLIEKITGYKPIYVPRNSYYTKYMCTGSILNWADRDTIVWGAGLANKDDVVGPCDIRAVRGPLTRERVQFCLDKVVDVLGDPALLAPRLYQPKVKTEFKLGIVPHYVDQAVIYPFAKSAGIKFINVFDSVEKVIDDICRCRRILSSSLHGLILAHAYGRPAKWFEASNQVGGDTMKFKDYLLSVGIEPYKPLKFYEIQDLSVEELCKNIGSYNADIQVDELWEMCPFK